MNFILQTHVEMEHSSEKGSVMEMSALGIMWKKGRAN